MLIWAFVRLCGIFSGKKVINTGREARRHEGTKGTTQLRRGNRFNKKPSGPLPPLRAFFILLPLCTGCSTVSFLPAQVGATLHAPNHVEAYRVGTLDTHPGYGGKMDGFAVFSTGHASPGVAASLASAVADSRTYGDAVQSSDFVPDVGFRFYRRLPDGPGQLCVDVLISFASDEVLLVARNEKLREDFRRLFTCEPGRKELVDLTREAFEFEDWAQALSEFEPESRGSSDSEAHFPQ
jgi:hypothetical protein